MELRRALLVVGLVSFVAVAQAGPDGELPIGMPGMETHRIDEPVFHGHAYVYEAGKEHLRTILLVHGVGDKGARDYVDHIGWLSRSWHVLAVDLPGFAHSDKANVLYSPTNYAAFLKYVVDRYAHKPLVLVGHSMGAVAALRYASRYPADLDRLVIADAPGVLHRYAFSSLYLAHLGLDFLPPAVDPLPKLANLARKILGHIAGTKLEPEVVLDSETLRETVLGGDPHKIAGLAAGIDDLSARISAVTMPTLVIWGGQDTTAPLRTGKVLAHVLPHARLAVIERSGHVPMEDTPERFRAVLEPFLVNGLGDDETPSPPLERHGDLNCRGKQDLVYEGEYERVVLNDCQNIRIRNARIGELSLARSTASIEDSRIGGGEVGVYANDATVVMTNVRIDADVAVVASDSRFDIAGADIDARQAVMRAAKTSTVAFSLCHVHSPALNGMVHHFYFVSKENSL